VEDVVEKYGADDYEAFNMQVLSTYAIETPFNEEEYRRMDNNKKVDILYDAVIKAFNRKMDRLGEVADPIIQQIVADQTANGVEPEQLGLIRVPITDGKRVFGIVVGIKEAADTHCKSLTKAWQKAVMLLTIDENWKEHLREMDQLRQSVQNASYEQKDPLVIYKTEAFNIFKQMVGVMNNKAIAILMRGQIPEQAPEQNVQEREPQRQQPRYSENRGGGEADPGARQQGTPMGPRPQGPTGPVRNEGPKIGRNDPCPCGSGKKYKNCHGKGLV